MVSLRSPCVIRLVTCSVLLISDLDVIFSLLFMWNLIVFDTFLTNFFIFVIIVGLLTYSAAVLYVGPKNKFRTIKILRHMMVEQRHLFEIAASPGSPKQFLDDSMRVLKNQTSAHPTFQSLELDQSGREQFQAGMASYGFASLWVYADAQNAKNVCERKHGIPFFRLANFGFMAAPTARDLAGILNANSAYTFCTGILQLSFGGYLASVIGWPLPLTTILPLIVSFLSLVLSACNVLLNFSRLLTEIDEEQRIADNMESTSKGQLDADKAKLEATRDKKIEDARATFQRSQKTEFEKQAMNHAITSADAEYDIDANKINNDNVARLVSELNMHRIRLQKIKEARTGNLPPIIAPPVGLASEKYNKLKQEWEELIARRRDVFEQEKSGLDVTSPRYTEKMLAINRKRDDDINILNQEMRNELGAVSAEP